MRLVWSLVIGGGLLIAAFLFGGRLAPPEQVTQPAASPAAILPIAAPASTEPVAVAPARGAPDVTPAVSVVAPLAAAGANSTEEESSPAAVGDAGRVRPNVALPTPLNVDKTWRHRMRPTPAPPPVKRATALAPISPPRDDVRPTPAPGRGTPSLSAQAPTPTPCCGLDPPPLDRARPGSGR